MLLYSKFEKHAKNYPNDIAISSLEDEITYGKLQLLSDRIAHFLKNINGIKKSNPIGIVIPKCWYQVLAVIAIQKAGMAYLPISTNESDQRQTKLIKEGNVSIILTLESLCNLIPTCVRKFSIEALINEEHNYPISNNQNSISENDLAYIIYTSGSTGLPKGVMITHKNALNTIEDINKKFLLTKQDKLFALSSLDFDLSVYDIYGALSVGATIVIPNQEKLKDPKHWLDLMIQKKITIWNSVPRFVEMLIKYLEIKQSVAMVSSLRLFLLSGDWIPLGLPTKIQKFFLEAQIISLGGATECSIWSIMYSIGVINPSWKSIPYGKPLENQFFYILDNKMKEIPFGEIGELYIGGMGVAQGYWNDKKATNEKFIDHLIYGRIYKSGDIGRYLPDGNIEFLGRLDFQIEIQGIKIETSAICKLLESISHIETGCVYYFLNQNNVHQLIAFAVVEAIDKIFSDQALQESLGKKQLNDWKKIYDATFKVSPDSTFNTAGWISSYSSKALGVYHMREWVDETLNKLKKLSPTKILEMGCGTGLILCQLAKHEGVKIYDAIDNAQSSIETVSRIINESNEYSHVFLSQKAAHEVDQGFKKYDLVVLNSIIQYFPSSDYLYNILNIAVNNVMAGGKIFIGDVYNLDYLYDFHTTVQLQKLRMTQTFDQLQYVVNQNALFDNKLYVSPDFFLNYALSHSRVSHISIQMKQGKYHNEMNTFRYDVTLYLESEIPEPGQEIILLPNASLNDLLEKQKPQSIIMDHLLNKRMSELFILEKIRNRLDSKESIKSIREKIYCGKDEAQDPYHLVILAQRFGYQVDFTWSSKYYYRAVFYKDRNPLIYDIKNVGCESKERHQTNFPLRSLLYRELKDNMMERLNEDLPSYMVPKEVILLPDLPLTQNGKIDREGLQHIYMMKLSLESILQEEALPLSIAEKIIWGIWKKTLNVQHIDIDANFFMLGGDSLLMLDVIEQIERKFRCHLSVVNFLSAATIRELAILVERGHVIAID